MIEIYGAKTCTACARAVGAVKQYGLEYKYFDISSDGDAMLELAERIGRPKTIPQTFWHGKHIGGADDLIKEIENTRNYGDGQV